MAALSRRSTDAPAEEAARLLLRLGVFLLFVISLVAPILARQTVYVLPPIGAALLLAATLFMEDARPAASLRASLLSPPLLAMLLLVFWTGMSLLWTPFEGPGERFGKSVATLALVAFAVGFLPLKTKTSNLNLLPIGVGLAVLALTAITVLMQPKYAAEDVHDVSALGRAGLGLALLVWPAMGALVLRDRWYVAGALYVATAVACALAGAPNTLQALLVGGAFCVAAFGRVRQTASMLSVAMTAVILLAPLAALAVNFLWPLHPPGFLRYLGFWGGMISQDGLRTLIGHGFGSATWGVREGFLAAATPRSLVFKTWFDLGVVGAAALAFVGWRAVAAVGAARARLTPFLLGGLAAGFAISVTGPAAEQLWWLTLAGLDAIAYALVMRGQFRKERPPAPAIQSGIVDAA